jgi:hypothetical protein
MAKEKGKDGGQNLGGNEPERKCDKRERCKHGLYSSAGYREERFGR